MVVLDVRSSGLRAVCRALNGNRVVGFGRKNDLWRLAQQIRRRCRVGTRLGSRSRPVAWRGQSTRGSHSRWKLRSTWPLVYKSRGRGGRSGSERSSVGWARLGWEVASKRKLHCTRIPMRQPQGPTVPTAPMGQLFTGTIQSRASLIYSVPGLDIGSFLLPHLSLREHTFSLALSYGVRFSLCSTAALRSNLHSITVRRGARHVPATLWYDESLEISSRALIRWRLVTGTKGC